MARELPRRCSTRYFSLEDPRRLEPAERELYVEALLDSKLLLRGFVDRIDIAPDGSIRVVDYKSGNAPSEMFEAKALFQMKFYALVIWKTRGVVPAMLQLVYLGNAQILRYVPDEQDLLATQRKVEAVWQAIRQAEESGDWRPNPGRQCSWCAHQAICPPSAARRRRCPSEQAPSISRVRTCPTERPLPTDWSPTADIAAENVRLVTNRCRPARPGRTTLPGPSAVVGRPDLGKVDADQRVGKDPALVGEHRDVVLDDQDQAAGALGGLGPGVGVLDGHAVARRRSRARRQR